MIQKNLESLRFETLKNLFEKLIAIELFKDNINLYDQKIEIVFHTQFILTITIKCYFEICINNVISCSKIEDVDIWETLHDYFQEDIIYIEYDSLFGKNKIAMLSRDKYVHQKEKLKGKPNVKIFTIRELLYKS